MGRSEGPESEGENERRLSRRGISEGVKWEGRMKEGESKG